MGESGGLEVTAMEIANLYAAWIGIFLGFVAGAVLGLFFHNAEWLGGYASWTRRMLRLGHISFFGLAFINLAFVLSVSYLRITDVSPVASVLLIVGAVTMPLVCFLSAFIKPFRHLFFIPVSSLIIGTAIFVCKELL